MTPSAGCATCGACCERITPSIARHDVTAIVSTSGGFGVVKPGVKPTARGYQRARPIGGRYARDAAFMLRWMRPTGDVERQGDMVRQVWTCDAFDPVHRLCTQHADRPEMCAGYPWYGREPHEGVIREPDCSYLADLPPDRRPAGSRPLIPVTVVRRT